MFVHGIGIGLYAYVDFIQQLALTGLDDDTDGQVGIIALELLPIGGWICPALPSAAVLRGEIQNIIKSHGWGDFVLVGHSFGSAVAANILRDSEVAKRVKATVLIDPICFLLHLPDVAYNFTRRAPSRANEHMLHYFASQDMMTSHTLARRFFWSEHVIFKEELKDLSVTVVLSGQDLIVPAKVVWTYLTGKDMVQSTSTPGSAGNGSNGDTEWRDGRLRVLWFEKFDHAGMFASKGARRGVAKIAQEYSRAPLSNVSDHDSDSEAHV